MEEESQVTVPAAGKAPKKPVKKKNGVRALVREESKRRFDAWLSEQNRAYDKARSAEEGRK